MATDRMYGQMVSPGNGQVGRCADTLGGWHGQCIFINCTKAMQQNTMLFVTQVPNTRERGEQMRMWKGHQIALTQASLFPI